MLLWGGKLVSHSLVYICAVTFGLLTVSQDLPVSLISGPTYLLAHMATLTFSMMMMMMMMMMMGSCKLAAVSAI